jgi:predicted site-specific integrase-resolvase
MPKIRGMPPAKLIGTSRAAVILDVTPETVRSWAKLGKLRHVVTPSGRIMFDPADLEGVYRVVESEPAEATA